MNTCAQQLAFTLPPQFKSYPLSICTSLVLEDILRFPERAEPHFYINPVKSYGLTKLTTLEKKWSG